MVTWAADGYMNGILRKELHSGPGGPLADAAVYDGIVGKFTVPGSVDAEIVTRLQYHIPFGTHDASWNIANDLWLGGSFTFTALDFAANPGINYIMAAYVVPSDRFDDGYIPTPAEIVASAEGTEIYWSEGWEYGGIHEPAASLGFSVHVPATKLDTSEPGPPVRLYNLQPNTKYWCLFVPVGLDDTTHVYRKTFPADGRALTFWTNRTPEAPTITSPDSGTIVTAGKEISFAFLPNDPDGTNGSPGDYRSWSFADLAGVQVQYAPRPTVAVPHPVWTDLPIATNQPGVPPEVGQGWYIEYMTDPDRWLGAKGLRDKRFMPLQCGATSVHRGAGQLPSGNWQVRMRTFDYGHSMSTVRHTDDALPGYGPLGTKGPDSPSFPGDGTSPSETTGDAFPPLNWTPDTYPPVNTSPWSTPCNITVTTEVPAPVAISPINHIAIPEGNDVVLRWQYKNTHQPPFPQEAREVQIRRRGETDWTTVVSGNNADHFYNVTDMLPGNGPAPTPAPLPFEYLNHQDDMFFDLGFEDGSAQGWETSPGGVLTAEEFPLPVPPDFAVVDHPHSGDWALMMMLAPPSSTTEYPFRRRIALNPGDKFFNISGWATPGPITTKQTMIVWFLNGPVVGNVNTDYPPYPDILGPLVNGLLPSFVFEHVPGEWTYQEFLNVQKPIGATQMWIMISGTAPSQQNIYDGIDDFSVLGSPTSPVLKDPIPPMDLLTVAPTAYPLPATIQYEWRVRVADSGHVTSAWSTPAQFWMVPAPNSGPVIPFPGDTIEGATLGCGTHRVEVYRRGGKVRVGELTQVSYLDWGRLRDDISDAKIVVSGWDVDCGNLLASLQTWAYEVVIFRDNGYGTERVWEGPITLITYENEQVTIHAKDVVAYLYRRIIKQPTNDSGTGGDTVVLRASRIIQNVLAPDDPNVLAYLQPIDHETDAREYRNLPAWTRTAYEEIDDMAANAGLDYTAVGRAILLWGTKSRIGTLPELRDENLGSSPIVSEYGMSMANVYAVADGQGTYGAAYRLPLPPELVTSDEIYGPEGEDKVYGLVEMLSSSWASDSEEEAGTFTEEGLATVRASFEAFAERSIADRYPPPVVVRIPDNTTLNPNTVLNIQNLVPGVVIPLRSDGTLRTVKANQKLDSIRVVESSGGETISITLSPFNHDDLAAPEEGE